MAKKVHEKLVALRNMFVDGELVERGQPFKVETKVAHELRASKKAVPEDEAAKHFSDKEKKGK